MPEMFMSTAARLNMRHTEKKIMKYYDDGGPGRGNCTWGVGILAHKGPCTPEELARKVTDTDIEREFAKRLKVAEDGVRRNVKVSLTQAQFDALVSLAYNAGVFGSHKVFDKLNAGDFDGAADVIQGITSGHEVRHGKDVAVHYKGLAIRRAKEAALFRNAANAPVRSAAK
jgi:GH24 family phage-related lysozyme (muramidase)